MSTHIFKTAPQKKAANLSINSDLLRLAKENRINLSQVLEQRLIELLREQKQQQWSAENRAAIDSYNQRVEADGVYSEGLRSF